MPEKVSAEERSAHKRGVRRRRSVAPTSPASQGSVEAHSRRGTKAARRRARGGGQDAGRSRFPILRIPTAPSIWTGAARLLRRDDRQRRPSHVCQTLSVRRGHTSARLARSRWDDGERSSNRAARAESDPKKTRKRQEERIPSADFAQTRKYDPRHHPLETCPNSARRSLRARRLPRRCSETVVHDSVGST